MQYNESDITNNLLDYFLAHGASKASTRFHLPPRTLLSIMREAGVPIRRPGQVGPHMPALQTGVGGGRLSPAQRSALRAEFVPGKAGENTRLAGKYGISSAGVAYLTKHLRPA